MRMIEMSILYKGCYHVNLSAPSSPALIRLKVLLSKTLEKAKEEGEKEEAEEEGAPPTEFIYLAPMKKDLLSVTFTIFATYVKGSELCYPHDHWRNDVQL